jgi:hypothetical protein
MSDDDNFPQTDEPSPGGPFHNRDQRSDPGIGGQWGQALGFWKNRRWAGCDLARWIPETFRM